MCAATVSSAGSVLDMATAVRNCVRLLDVSLELALRCLVHPAKFLGLDHRRGQLRPAATPIWWRSIGTT